MRTSRLAALLIAVAAVALLASNASAMYNPSLGRWMQRDPGPGGVMHATPRVGGGPVAGGAFLPRDPTGPYHDGMNLYQYAKAAPTHLRDPQGTNAVYEVAFDSTKNLESSYFYLTYEVKAHLNEYSAWWYGIDNKSDYYALGQEITVELKCWNSISIADEPPAYAGSFTLTEVLALVHSVFQTWATPGGEYGYYQIDHHRFGLRRSKYGDTTKACMCKQTVNVRSYILDLNGTDYDDLPFGWHRGFVTSLNRTGLYEDKEDIDAHMNRGSADKLKEVSGSSFSWGYEARYYPSATPPKKVQLRNPKNITGWPF